MISHPVSGPADEAWARKRYRTLTEFRDGRRALGEVRLVPSEDRLRVREVLFTPKAGGAEVVLDPTEVEVVLTAVALEV